MYAVLLVFITTYHGIVCAITTASIKILNEYSPLQEGIQINRHTRTHICKTNKKSISLDQLQAITMHMKNTTIIEGWIPNNIGNMFKITWFQINK